MEILVEGVEGILKKSRQSDRQTDRHLEKYQRQLAVDEQVGKSQLVVQQS
jgi:hypothetical protein